LVSDGSTSGILIIGSSITPAIITSAGSKRADVAIRETKKRPLVSAKPRENVKSDMASIVPKKEE